MYKAIFIYKEKDMNKVLFVGSNPSAAAASNEPFDLSTRSGKVLKSWIEKVGITSYAQLNVAQYPTENNRPLSKKEIEEAVPQLRKEIMPFYEAGYKIVALGRTAGEAVSKCYRFIHIELPHPSGLNRKLNDPQYVEEELERLRRYTSETGEYPVQTRPNG
jgi:uracil-DNA glycosylase